VRINNRNDICIMYMMLPIYLLSQAASILRIYVSLHIHTCFVVVVYTAMHVLINKDHHHIYVVYNTTEDQRCIENTVVAMHACMDVLLIN